MGERVTLREVLLAAVALSPAEQQLLVSRVWNALPAPWVFPGPRPASPLAFARIRYARSGLRQWVIWPGLEGFA